MCIIDFEIRHRFLQMPKVNQAQFVEKICCNLVFISKYRFEWIKLKLFYERISISWFFPLKIVHFQLIYLLKEKSQIGTRCKFLWSFISEIQNRKSNNLLSNLLGHCSVLLNENSSIKSAQKCYFIIINQCQSSFA